MKLVKYICLLFLLSILFDAHVVRAQCGGYPTTPNLALGLPTIGATSAWGTCLNNDLTALDGVLGGTSTLTLNSTTPSVAGVNTWIASNTSGTAITNFTGGYPGQPITVFCNDLLTTMANGTNLSLRASFNCANAKAIQLTLIGSVWTERARADFGNLTTVSGVSTFTLPLASSSTITSITNISSTSATFTCSSGPAGCGLGAFVGTTVNLGQGLNSLPTTCQGPMTVSSVGSTTVTMTSMPGNCATAASVSYASVFGTFGNLINFVPAQGNNTPGSTPTQYTSWFEDYDGHVLLTAVYNSVNRAQLSIDTTGQAWLTDFVNPIAVGTEQTSQARATAGSGGLCLAVTPVSAGCGGTEFIYDPSNGIVDALVKYRGVVSSAPATVSPTNSSTSITNSLIQADGPSFTVLQVSPTSVITPSAGATTTVNFGTIYTTPTTNYGAGTIYELKGVIICSTNCAGTQSVYVTVTYNDAIATRTLSTCGSGGGAGSVYAICQASNPTTAWVFNTAGASMPFDFPAIYVAGNQAITMTVTTTNGGTAQPTYYMAYVLETH